MSLDGTALVKLKENPFTLPGGFAPERGVAPELVQFEVRKSIDRLQITVKGYKFNALTKKLDECFQHVKSIFKGPLYIHAWVHGKTKICLISWGPKFSVHIILTSISNEVQSMLISHVLIGCETTLSQIEFTLDFVNNTLSNLVALREHLEDGLILNGARHFGANFYKRMSYYGSKGYARNSKINGKRTYRTKGLAFYFKILPDGSTTLRVELKLNRTGITKKSH